MIMYLHVHLEKFHVGLFGQLLKVKRSKTALTGRAVTRLKDEYLNKPAGPFIYFLVMLVRSAGQV